MLIEVSESAYMSERTPDGGSPRGEQKETLRAVECICLKYVIYRTVCQRDLYQMQLRLQGASPGTTHFARQL